MRVSLSLTRLAVCLVICAACSPVRISLEPLDPPPLGSESFGHSATFASGFGTYLLTLFLSLVVAESFMCLVASIVPHYIIGIALGAGVFGFFMLCEAPADLCSKK